MKSIALTVLVMASVMACTSTNKLVKQPPKSHVAVSEYKIGVNDVLQVSVWKSPELSSTVPVRPDGRISVPLIGDVYAAGKSTEDLTSELTNGLQKYVRNPQVTVVVSNPASGAYLLRVRATGAVAHPVSISHQQGITVLDLILEAGGLTEFAVGNKAKLYRSNGAKVDVYPVYLDDILQKGLLDTNYELQPTDIITVPERLF